MQPIALIPARVGSKSIPDKNFSNLAGMSPVGRAIQCAIAAGLKPVVSTDADWFGAEHPVCILPRPKSLASNVAPMSEVVKHALAAMLDADPIVLLQPTQPLRKPEHVLKALSLLAPEVDSVVSVVKVPSRYVSEAQHHINDGILLPYPCPGWATWATSGDLPTTSDLIKSYRVYNIWQSITGQRQNYQPNYIREGTVYAFWRRTVEQYGNIYGGWVVPLAIPPEETCALDTPEDWAEAERRLKLLSEFQDSESVSDVARPGQ